jgi:hypothetical protein
LKGEWVPTQADKDAIALWRFIQRAAPWAFFLVGICSVAIAYWRAYA